MQYVNGVYAQWFNREYELGGHLFERWYRATVLKHEEIALDTALPHRPQPRVRAGLVKRPEVWTLVELPISLGHAPPLDLLDEPWLPDRSTRCSRSFAALWTPRSPPDPYARPDFLVQAQQQLAELAGRGEGVERGLCLLHREHAVDDRAHPADLRAAARPGGRTPARPRPSAPAGRTRRPVPISRPRLAISLRSDISKVAPAPVPDHHDPAPGRQRVQIGVQIGRADQLQHHIHTAGLGPASTGSAPISASRARGPAEPAVTSTWRPAPARSAPPSADAPGRAVHQQRLPHPQPALRNDRVMRGDEHLGHRRRRRLVQRSGTATTQRSCTRHAIRHPAAADDPEHAVALASSRTGATHPTRVPPPPARDIGGRTGRSRRVPRPLQEVGRVDPTCATATSTSPPRATGSGRSSTRITSAPPAPVKTSARTSGVARAAEPARSGAAPDSPSCGN